MKIQIVAAITIDGFLSEYPEAPRRCFYYDKYSLDALRRSASRILHKDTSLIRLLNEKQQQPSSTLTYLAESSTDNMGFIKGLLLYSLADELILYIVPRIAGAGVRLFEGAALSAWKPAGNRTFSNGISRIVYRRG